MFAQTPPAMSISETIIPKIRFMVSLHTGLTNRVRLNGSAERHLFSCLRNHLPVVDFVSDALTLERAYLAVLLPKLNIDRLRSRQVVCAPRGCFVTVAVHRDGITEVPV
jgi:hypothetical protein